VIFSRAVGTPAIKSWPRRSPLTPGFHVFHTNAGTVPRIRLHILGVRGGVVVKTLLYKPEGRGINSR
jgi:hypothetical protein